MPKKLDDLYHGFCMLQEFTDIKSSFEQNHKIPIENQSKADRKTVLRIMNAKETICNFQSKASFIQGFKLGAELLTKLQNYNDHSLEKNKLSGCGHFFMSEEERSSDEKEN